MDPNAAAPVASRSSVTLRLVELEALDNPELFGAAEWSLRMWINGLERWQSPMLKVREGAKVPIGAEVVTEVHGYTDALEIEVKAREHDLLTPDDRAAGKLVLRRLAGFQPQGGSAIALQGKGADLRLHIQVEVRQL